MNRNVAELIVPRELTGALRERIRDYFPGCAGWEPRVQLVRQSRRHNCVVCEYVVSTDRRDRRLFVKARPPAVASATSNGDEHSRPRLFPMPDSNRITELEFAALSRIHEHFTKLNDSRFGVLQPLDYLAEFSALVMEHVPHASLGRLLTSNSRFGRGRRNLHAALRHAGAWLRVYHQLPGMDHTRDHLDTRADCVRSIDAFAEFLAAARRDSRYFDLIAAQVKSLADSVLPDRLPLGMSHGDYAPRNIFLGPADQVIVFDTAARWRAPTYKDIADFLIAMKLARAQVYSLGLAFSEATMARYERDFLQGYFDDDEVPLGAIRLFEKLVLMDKWSSLVHRSQQSHGVSRLARRTMLTLGSFGIRRLLKQPVPQSALQTVCAAS